LTVLLEDVKPESRPRALTRWACIQRSFMPGLSTS
jgi:hypothetical protein